MKTLTPKIIKEQHSRTCADLKRLRRKTASLERQLAAAQKEIVELKRRRSLGLPT